jgi:hypothetical protein
MEICMTDQASHHEVKSAARTECRRRYEHARRLACEVEHLLASCDDCELDRCFDAKLARALSRELTAQLEGLVER